MKKKVAIRAALLVAIFAGVLGFADALNLTSAGLGAADTVVTACQSAAMTAAWTPTYAAGIPGYQATTVTVSGLTAACYSKPFRMTLAGAGGAAQGVEFVGTTPASGTTFTATFTANAQLVTSMALVISG